MKSAPYGITDRLVSRAIFNKTVNKKMNKTGTIDVLWPEIFEIGIIPETMEDSLVCANALCAWGNCSVSPPHQNFGDVMAAVGQRLNCVPTPNGLESWAKQNGFL